MQFTKRLRDGVRRGTITCSVRIWKQPRVKVGGRYRVERGYVEVDSIDEITPDDITQEVAEHSGFADVDDLLSIAKHGAGDRIYLIEFHYVARPLSREER